jgi:hypothetical protein
MSYLTVANAIADEVIHIQVDEETTIPVPCLRLEDAQIPTAESLPLRIQFPPGGSGQKALLAAEWDTAEQYSVRWQIVELMLWCALPQGGGLSDSWPMVAGFVDAAVAHWMANRHIAGASIENIDPRAGVYEFPNGSEKYYHGVLTVLEVGVTCEV